MSPILLTILTLVVGAVLVWVLDELLLNPWLTGKIVDRFEKMPTFRVPEVAADSAAECVQFRTSDGLQLSGALWNAHQVDAPGLVLFFPEMTGSCWLASEYCQAMIRNGYVVFSLDFRGHGGSDCQPGYSPLHWLSEFEMLDVAAALEFVESHPRLSTLPILAFGVSRGGVAALTAGGRYPRIRGVIADSAFGTLDTMRFFADRFVDLFLPRWLYRLVPEWHVRRTIRRAIAGSEQQRGCSYVQLEAEVQGLEADRTLLISGAADTYITPHISAALVRLLGDAVRAWNVIGARHNQARWTEPQTYDRLILRHAAHCLGETQVADPAVPIAYPAATAVTEPV